jgi:hypothetical protein
MEDYFWNVTELIVVVTAHLLQLIPMAAHSIV